MKITLNNETLYNKKENHFNRIAQYPVGILILAIIGFITFSIFHTIFSAFVIVYISSLFIVGRIEHVDNKYDSKYDSSDFYSNDYMTNFGVLYIIMGIMISLVILAQSFEFKYKINTIKYTPDTIVRTKSEIILISNNNVLDTNDVTLYTLKNPKICKDINLNSWGIRIKDSYSICK